MKRYYQGPRSLMTANRPSNSNRTIHARGQRSVHCPGVDSMCSEFRPLSPNSGGHHPASQKRKVSEQISWQLSACATSSSQQLFLLPFEVWIVLPPSSLALLIRSLPVMMDCWTLSSLAICSMARIVRDTMPQDRYLR